MGALSWHDFTRVSSETTIFIDRSESAIIVCIKYSKRLDEPVHSGRADWLPANPERSISRPESNGQALEQVHVGLIEMEECPISDHVYSRCWQLCRNT